MSAADFGERPICGLPLANLMQRFGLQAIMGIGLVEHPFSESTLSDTLISLNISSFDKFNHQYAVRIAI